MTMQDLCKGLRAGLGDAAEPSRAGWVVLALCVALALAPSGSARAAEFNRIGSLNQAEFQALGEDLGSALAWRGLVPAESLGLIGFDVGASLGFTRLADRAVLRRASDGASVPSALPVTALRAHKGLPLNIDVGVGLLQVPGTPLRAVGGELRWALVPGSTVMPALAARVSTTRASGVNGLALDTVGADLSISKGFLFLTPYAGIGQVRVRAQAPGSSLREATATLDRRTLGLNIALVPLSLVIEAERTGRTESHSLKLALRF